jgi:hypothetical protein
MDSLLEKKEMTPTLTNAQKYSPSYGFSPGVVVEITRKSGIVCYGSFEWVFDGDIKIYEAKDHTGGIVSRLFECSSIDKIRLLSGPWAVWQFAPKNAIGVVHDFEANFILFYNNSHTDFDAHVKKHMGLNRYTYLPAPWWWLEGQK